MTTPDITEFRRLARNLHCGDSACRCTLNQSADMMDALADELERLRTFVDSFGAMIYTAWHSAGVDRAGGDWIAFANHLAAASPAAPAQQAQAVPEGYKLVAVKGFDDLMYW